MTGADFIVTVSGTSKTPGLSATHTDSEGNSYTALTAPDGPGSGNQDLRGRIHHCANAIVSGSMTFTRSGSSFSYPAIAAAGYSGIKTTSPFDVQTNSHGSGVTTLASGTATPSEDNCLVIAGFASNNTNTPTVPSGFTSRESRALVGGLAYGVSLSDQIQTTATARNPSWSWTSNNNDAVALTASFKAAAAAGHSHRKVNNSRLLAKIGGGLAS